MTIKRLTGILVIGVAALYLLIHPVNALSDMPNTLESGDLDNPIHLNIGLIYTPGAGLEFFSPIETRDQDLAAIARSGIEDQFACVDDRCVDIGEEEHPTYYYTNFEVLENWLAEVANPGDVITIYHDHPSITGSYPITTPPSSMDYVSALYLTETYTDYSFVFEVFGPKGESWTYTPHPGVNYFCSITGDPHRLIRLQIEELKEADTLEKACEIVLKYSPLMQDEGILMEASDCEY